MDDFQIGAVLFTTQLEVLATFYQRLADMRREQSHGDHVILMRDSFRLTVHQIPAQFASREAPTSPPPVRESAAIKLAFAVSDLAEARRLATTLGGAVYGQDREWRSETATYCDGVDPDGNVFQLVQV